MLLFIYNVIVGLIMIITSVMSTFDLFLVYFIAAFTVDEKDEKVKEGFGYIIEVLFFRDSLVKRVIEKINKLYLNSNSTD